MELTISIAGINILFNSSYDFRVQERFLPFLVENREADITVCFQEKNSLPVFTSRPVFVADNYKIYKDQNSIVWRCIYNRVRDNFYYAACALQKNKAESLVLYKKEEISQLNHLNGAMYHIGWENHLLHFNRFIFHASCIDTAFGGILFSGVSGIGKSTQADLWCRYEEAKLINGDRPIVGKADDQWKAFGSPYAGSSNCYVNASVPIKAIVFLGQGQNCSIKQLKGKAAFHKMLEQTTVNQWDQACMSKVCDLILELITVIPVYEMICTPDRDAVECLKELLQEEDSQNAAE